jgi:mannose-6-phosphate isomerase-like protein (cupin superfamily)
MDEFRSWAHNIMIHPGEGEGCGFNTQLARQGKFTAMRIAILPPRDWETSKRPEISKRIHPLAEGLFSRGIDVTIFDTAGSAKRWSGVPVRVVKVPNDLDSDLCSHLRMSNFLDIAREFDLVHNYDDLLPVVYSGFINPPVLTTILGLPSERALPAYRMFDGRAFYVSTSQADRSPGLTYVATVYQGIDLADFDVRETAGDYLVFAGDIKPEIRLEEAIEIARTSGRRLIIAGTVPDKHFAVEMSNCGHIESRGNVDSVGLTSLLKNAYCLINPGYDLDVLEANAHGTPVLTFARGSIPELITDGVNGFVVSDMPEAVEAVERIKLISRKLCREHVEARFSKNRMVDDYVRVYSQILDRRQREDLRPWGYYKVLSDLPDHKVKRIVIYPGKRLSLQRHRQRSEHWVIVSGQALVTLDAGVVSLGPGQSVDIPLGALHRIHNPCTEPLVFVEVQMGEYFGEDDIERLEDDFQRA